MFSSVRPDEKYFYEYHFYTPVQDGSYYVDPFVRPSVRPLSFRVRSRNLKPFKIFS